jgi:hypothetical protein
MSKATGPSTPKGKARSSRNAAKHWIESGRILPEEQQDAAILRGGFEEDFKPQALIEDEIIDDLVLNRLIRRRIDIAFTREFSKARIETVVQGMDRREHPAIQYCLRIATLSNQEGWAERLSPSGCISALKGLQDRIRDRGMQREDLKTISNVYGSQLTQNAAYAIYQLLAVEVKKIEQGEAETKEDPAAKKKILETIENEIQQQELREDLAQRMIAIETATDIQEPAAPTLELLLRYRAANTRELNSLLDSLERIRCLRQ